MSAFLVPVLARAQPNAASLAECLPQPTLPLPTCVPAESVEEHALVTLSRARAWLQTQQFTAAAQHLAASLRSLQGSADIGLRVRSHSLHGQALLGLSRFAEAKAELRAASSLWASQAALSWLRSLPVGRGSQRTLDLAADAASRAALSVAELHLRDGDVAPPRFAQGESPEPFAPRRDGELSQRERTVRDAWAERQRAAFVRFLQAQVPPWLARRRAAIQAAERELKQVYLVPPVLAPAWRVAVAADIGSLWSRFAEQQQRVAESCGRACDEFRTYSNVADSWEPDKQRARRAFEAGVAVSRQYRLLTEYTLVCEHWLARTFSREYSRLDELLPSAHWRASSLAAATRHTPPADGFDD